MSQESNSVNPVDLVFLLVAQFEGFRSTAYKDVGGVWTIGYGRTQDVKEGDTTTIETETEWTKTRLSWLWQKIDHQAGRDLNVNQAAALIDFAYNLGLGALERSTLFGLVQEGQWLPAADQFLRWDKTKVDGILVSVKGLQARRKAERALFLAEPPKTLA